MKEERELEEWRNTFILFDKKGDGSVDCSQIGDILRALSFNPTQGEINKILNEIDPIGTKRLTFEEFIPLINMIREKPRNSYNTDSFCEAFKMFDYDGNGLVRAAEIRHVLSTLGEQLRADELDALLEEMEDRNGLINYKDFISNVLEG